MRRSGSDVAVAGRVFAAGAGAGAATGSAGRGIGDSEFAAAPEESVASGVESWDAVVTTGAR